VSQADKSHHKLVAKQQMMMLALNVTNHKSNQKTTYKHNPKNKIKNIKRPTPTYPATF